MSVFLGSALLLPVPKSYSKNTNGALRPTNFQFHIFLYDRSGLKVPRVAAGCVEGFPFEVWELRATQRFAILMSSVEGKLSEFVQSKHFGS